MAFWSFSDDFFETVVLFVLILGFFLSTFADSLAMKFLLVFAVGLMFGRVWYIFKTRMKFVLTTIIAGFLLGFLVGNLLENIREIVILFLAGLLVSYYVHEKKLIKTL